MRKNTLGDTGLEVSCLCLGTMTWGEQNSKNEAHSQLDFAIERGINFIDTAEMYPVPPKKESYGDTERFIGDWSGLKEKRDQIILATKVVGPFWENYIRGGKTRLTKEHILAACDESLKRLKTDYIDLYQLHWPDRSTNCFGKKNFEYNPDEEITDFQETYEALALLKKEGKIRHIGVSNETPWGLMKLLQLSSQNSNFPRVVSIQNPYSLLNRTFEIGLAEVAIREKVGLLAYSPLAFGVLSGKYRGGALPPNSRLALYPQYNRYSKNSNALKATEAYCLLAKKFEMTPAQMALAFINERPFVTSNIIGGTTLKQLEENISSVEIRFVPEVLNEIEMIAERYSNPCP